MQNQFFLGLKNHRKIGIATQAKYREVLLRTWRDVQKKNELKSIHSQTASHYQIKYPPGSQNLRKTINSNNNNNNILHLITRTYPQRDKRRSSTIQITNPLQQFIQMTLKISKSSAAFWKWWWRRMNECWQGGNSRWVGQPPRMLCIRRF
jgi:hypothetical protein